MEEVVTQQIEKVADQIATTTINQDAVVKAIQDSGIADKIKPSTGIVLSYVETFLIFVLVYILPIPLLFLDNILKITLGQAVCKFYELNLQGIIFIYSMLALIFVGKSFTKTKELKADELNNRTNMGKTIVSIVGTSMFALYVIVYPILNFFTPYISTYANNITWQSGIFIFVIGGIYIANKVLFAWNKDTLLQNLSSESWKGDKDTFTPTDPTPKSGA